jgi:hypothetical protein
VRQQFGSNNQAMEKSTADLIKDGEFISELINDNEFCEFILREAERTIVHASVEDLAVFGFGSLEDAVDSYRECLEAKENRA